MMGFDADRLVLELQKLCEEERAQSAASSSEGGSSASVGVRRGGGAEELGATSAPPISLPVAAGQRRAAGSQAEQRLESYKTRQKLSGPCFVADLCGPNERSSGCGHGTIDDRVHDEELEHAQIHEQQIWWFRH